MTVTFTIGRQAHWRAIRDLTKRTLSYKVSVGFFVVLPVLIVLFGVVRGASLGSYLLNNLAFVLFGPLIVFVGFPYTYRLTVSRAHKNNALLAKPQTFELTADHLVMRGPLHNSDVNWNAISQVVETRDTFLFFVSKYNAYFIPKEGLTTGEIHALRTGLAEWLPGRVQLRSDEPQAQNAAA
jgi:hypothetical protein